MSSTGQGPAPGRGRGDQLRPHVPKTNQDPQGGVQASSLDLTGLLAEWIRMPNTIQAGGVAITQPQIDSITARIHGTT